MRDGDNAPEYRQHCQRLTQTASGLLNRQLRTRQLLIVVPELDGHEDGMRDFVSLFLTQYCGPVASGAVGGHGSAANAVVDSKSGRI
jgi:hypothetical protein